MEYIKHFCNGVLPGRLWEVVNKGSELNDLANGLAGAASLQVRKAYKLGEDAAFYDGHKMLDLHTNPNGLELFLLGLPLEFIGQPEWNS